LRYWIITNGGKKRRRSDVKVKAMIGILKVEAAVPFEAQVLICLM
jgi:hypothetical protein